MILSDEIHQQASFRGICAWLVLSPAQEEEGKLKVFSERT